jgi:hypothetical protein
MSEKEGELKKQIDSLVSPDGGFILVQDLKYILDEAKKDFPDWKKEKGIPADELSTETLWRNCLNKLKEIDVWYEKWFGSNKK